LKPESAVNQIADFRTITGKDVLRGIKSRLQLFLTPEAETNPHFAEVGFFKDEERQGFDNGIEFRIGGVIDTVAVSEDKRPQTGDGKIYGLYVCDIGMGILLLPKTSFNLQGGLLGEGELRLPSVSM